MYGFVPVILPMLFNRLFENRFGPEVLFPAKSGKLENSNAYEMKASGRTGPALSPGVGSKVIAVATLPSGSSYLAKATLER